MRERGKEGKRERGKEGKEEKERKKRKKVQSERERSTRSNNVSLGELDDAFQLIIGGKGSCIIQALLPIVGHRKDLQRKPGFFFFSRDESDLRVFQCSGEGGGRFLWAAWWVGGR
jgi:hypothetical protein